MIKTANLTGSVSRSAGGLFESVRRLVQSLADTGMEVRVFGTEDRFTAADMAAWHPVPVSSFRPSWPERFGYSPNFLRELVAFAPDIIHTHGLWLYPSVAADWYGRKRSCPYLISPHGMLDPWAVRHSRWKKRLAYLLYEGAHLRHARCLRALCEPEARAIRELGLRNDIAIIPNGTDLPVLVESSELTRLRLTSARQVVDGPLSKTTKGGRKVLLYLGRIHPKKGLVNLLKAWASTLNHQPPTINSWVLAIAGWDQGGHEAELKRLCDELSIPWADIQHQPEAGSISAFSFQLSAFSILFLGPQFDEAKAACYRDCDAFILPSFSEGLPMVVLEAWAYGKPVLMTPECNLPEGFAVDAALRIETNPTSIAEALRELFSAPEASHRALGAKGRDLVAKRFTWAKVGSEMKAVYEWVLGSGSKPSCVVP